MKSKPEPHELEKLFCLSAGEILDVVLSNNRTLMNLKGAIAQEHLRRHLKQLARQHKIDSFHPINREGEPDFKVFYRNREFAVECKNVQKTLRKSKGITIDFMRTRNPIGKPWLRYYSPNEFDVLAACTFNQTGKWEFRFIPTRFLRRHPEFSNRLDNKVSLDPSQDYFRYWTDDLGKALELLCQQS
jgi:hypothetical protein